MRLTGVVLMGIVRHDKETETGGRGERATCWQVSSIETERQREAERERADVIEMKRERSQH